jgi:hypothetical protein
MGRKERDGDPYHPDAPGWYPDPWSATGGGERYFDGKHWGSTERPRARESTVVVPMERPRGRRRPGRGPRGPRGPRSVKALVARYRVPLILVLIGVAAVGLYALQESRGPSGFSGPTSDPSIGVTHPPPGAEESAQRLSPTPTTIAGPGDHEFQRVQPGSETSTSKGTPVAFSPCRPIHWVYNPAGAPPDGLAAVRDGFARLADATGLKFVDDGETDEVPDRDRAAYLPTKYDRDRWAPVLIAWSDENGFRDLVGHVTGATRPDMLTLGDGRSVYVSGVVVLDSADLSEAAVPDRAIVRATVLHELGHLVGLDHTTDRSQLMFSESRPDVVDYGPGDRRGLAAEGSQACFPEV